MNYIKRFFILTFLLVCSLASANTIKIIVPYAAGGVSDKISRYVQTVLNNNGFNTVLEYKLGAGGFIAYNYVARTKGEMVIVVASNGIAEIIDPKVADYQLEDFVPIKHLGSMPAFVLTGHPNIQTFADLTALSKTRPINYGSSGVGSGTHIAGAIVGNQYNNFVHVPYKGQSQAIIDVISGQIDFTIESNIAAEQFIQSQKLRPLAVMSRSRLKDYPNVPTLKELGVNDYEYSRLFVLVGNRDVDTATAAKLHRILSTKDVQADLEKLDLHPVKTTPTMLQDISSKFQRIRKNVKFD